MSRTGRTRQMLEQVLASDEPTVIVVAPHSQAITYMMRMMVELLRFDGEVLRKRRLLRRKDGRRIYFATLAQDLRGVQGLYFYDHACYQ